MPVNPIHPKILERANDAAIYTLYLYLVHKAAPATGEALHTIVSRLADAANSQNWNFRDSYRLRVLQNAVARRPHLADSRLGSLTYSESGSTACSFTNPEGDVFVVFRGTGSGEWLDNAEGLSGIPGENVYMTYKRNGDVASMETVRGDYATGQQVEALNWFRYIAAQNGWDTDTNITLAGHSKGGNKAQFIALHSDLVDECFSFDGQGFSPEALAAFKRRHGEKFAARRRNIRSLSADNDYVNVLGDRLMPETRIYYFASSMGLHYLEAILDRNGRFLSQSEQGKLSLYAQNVSEALMRTEPAVRQYVTVGVMDLFQQHLSGRAPVNADAVSLEKTIAGISVAIGALLEPLGYDQPGISHADT